MTRIAGEYGMRELVYRIDGLGMTRGALELNGPYILEFDSGPSFDCHAWAFFSFFFAAFSFFSASSFALISLCGTFKSVSAKFLNFLYSLFISNPLFPPSI